MLVSRSHTAVGWFALNATSISSVLRYQRMKARHDRHGEAESEPGNWKNAKAASNRAKPAMIIVAVRAHGWSPHRPPATSSQAIPVATESQPHSPTLSYSGRSPKVPNQSKPITLRP